MSSSSAAPAPDPGAASAPATRSPASGTRAAQRPLGRDFNRFWAGTLSSNLGDGLVFTAMPIIAASLTNDPLLIAGLAVARFLPWLLFGVLVGAVADRVDRVRLMVGVNLVRVAVLVVLAVLIAADQATVWTLIAAVFVVMSCEAFYDTASAALLPQLSPTGTLNRANSRLTAGRSITESFLGSPLSGLLFAVAAFMPLVSSVGAYLLGAVVLLGLPLAVRRAETARESAPPPPENALSAEPEKKTPESVPPEPESASAQGASARGFFDDIREGLRYALAQTALRNVVLFLALGNVLLLTGAGVQVLLVQQHYGVPAALYGVFLTSAAAGALAASAVASWSADRLGRFGHEVLCYLLLGSANVLFVLTSHVAVGALALVTISFAATASNIVLISALQTVTPNHMLGRVMSLVMTLGMGVAPIGAVLGGLLGRVDLRLPFVVAGIGMLLAFLVVAPSMRRLMAQADAADSEREAEEAGNGRADRDDGRPGPRS